MNEMYLSYSMLICTIVVILIQNALSELKPFTSILKTAGSSNVVIKFKCIITRLRIFAYLHI